VVEGLASTLPSRSIDAMSIGNEGLVPRLKDACF
jgi:hypothetical protein